MGGEDRCRWQHVWSNTASPSGSGAQVATSPKSCLGIKLFSHVEHGAAYAGRSFLCEPLSPGLHLFCAHMDTVVRCICAIQCTLLKLARIHADLAMQALSAPFRQIPSALLPYYFGKAYPEALVVRLFSQTNLIFRLTLMDGQQRCVKFVGWSQARYSGPPRLGTCQVCSQLGRHLMLCVLRFAIMSG